MNHNDDEMRQTVALFRYGVIADLVHLPVGTPGLIARRHDKAATDTAAGPMGLADSDGHGLSLDKRPRSPA